MTDLVKRLRERDAGDMMYFEPDTLCVEAADRIEQLERELAGARGLVFASGVELGKAEAQLAAERKRAQIMHRRAQKSEGKNARYAWWFRVISGIAKHHKDWYVAQYARAGIDGAALHMGTAWTAAFDYWKKAFRAELAAEKALADRLYKSSRIYRARAGEQGNDEFLDSHTAYRKARGL